MTRTPPAYEYDPPPDLPSDCAAGRALVLRPDAADAHLWDSWGTPCDHPIAGHLIIQDPPNGGPPVIAGLCQCHALELEARGAASREPIR